LLEEAQRKRRFQEAKAKAGAMESVHVACQIWIYFTKKTGSLLVNICILSSKGVHMTHSENDTAGYNQQLWWECR
jgi:hypothetical protein